METKELLILSVFVFFIIAMIFLIVKAIRNNSSMDDDPYYKELVTAFSRDKELLDNIILGETKITGFKFKSSLDIKYLKEMNEYIGRQGTIVAYSHKYDSYTVMYSTISNEGVKIMYRYPGNEIRSKIN